MKAFIGRCLLAGMHRSNHDEPVVSLCSDKESRTNFTDMMSRNSFTDNLEVSENRH